MKSIGVTLQRNYLTKNCKNNNLRHPAKLSYIPAITISVVFHPEKKRLCFVPLVQSYFWVVPSRSWFSKLAPALVTTYSMLIHLLQTAIYKMFWLVDLQKMNFMLDIVTKWGKCHYKMGSFLFYKTGQVVLESRVGITE